MFDVNRFFLVLIVDSSICTQTTPSRILQLQDINVASKVCRNNHYFIQFRPLSICNNVDDTKQDINVASKV